MRTEQQRILDYARNVRFQARLVREDLHATRNNLAIAHLFHEVVTADNKRILSKVRRRRQPLVHRASSTTQ